MTSLNNCPRCGGTHQAIEADRLTNPVLGEWTHWGTCPTTGQPVLFRYVYERTGAMWGLLERSMELYVKELNDQAWAEFVREIGYDDVSDIRHS